MERAFFNAREKGLTEYVLLEILTGEEHYEKVAGMLGRFIRQTDYLGVLKGGRLCALLSNTNTENVGGTMGRMGPRAICCRVSFFWCLHVPRRRIRRERKSCMTTEGHICSGALS